MTHCLYLLPAGLALRDEQWPCQLLAPASATLMLADASAQLGGLPVTVLLPMEMFSWLLSEPWAGRTPGVQALAYSLEEQLASDPDTLQLFASAADAQQRYGLWVTEREPFEALLHLINALGINAKAVYVDVDLLATDRPRAVWAAGRWLLGGGLPARLALPDNCLASLQAQLPAALRSLKIPREDGLAGLLGTHAALNLLGPAPPAWPLRTLALSLALMGLMGVASLWLQTAGLAQQANDLALANQQRFSHLYPAHTQQADLATQLSALQRLAQQPAIGPMASLQALAHALVANGDVHISQMTWSAGQGWTLQVRASDLATLQRLSERDDLPLRLGSASQGKAHVDAVLLWEPAP